MMGCRSERGLIPRIGRTLFDLIAAQNDNTKFWVQVSYLAIYTEKRARNLLNPKQKKNLGVRDHPSLGPYVEDLCKLVVSSSSELLSLVAEGNRTRTVVATDMNHVSSRSHAVVNLVLT